MTIFGETELVIDNITYIHNKTVWDETTNYTYGSLLIILIPLGIIFNVLVYIKNHIDSGTPSSVIYRSLALSDFLVCTFRGLQQVIALFSPRQEKFYDHSTPTNMTRVIAVITMSSGICMMTVITLLSMLRLLSFVLPFWARAQSTRIMYFVAGYILATVVTSTGIAIQFVFEECVYFSSITQWVQPCKGVQSAFIINFIIPLVCMSLTTLSSIATFVYLLRSGTSSRRKSSITILLMSGGVIIWNIMLFGASDVLPIDYKRMPDYLKRNQYEVYYLYYLVTCFYPIVLAVYNSSVVVLRSSAIREFISIAWRWVEAAYNHAVRHVELDGQGTETTRLITGSSSS